VVIRDTADHPDFMTPRFNCLLTVGGQLRYENATSDLAITVYVRNVVNKQISVTNLYVVFFHDQLCEI